MGAFLSIETLSLLVSVLVMVLVLIVWRRHWLAWNGVPSFRPACQILVAASLAAEGTPPLLYGVLAAQDAQPRVAHPANSNSRIVDCAIADG
jgi:hypothetical protein